MSMTCTTDYFKTMLVLAVWLLLFVLSNDAAVIKVQRLPWSDEDEYNDGYDYKQDISPDEILKLLCSFRRPPYNWNDDNFKEYFRDMIESIDRYRDILPGDEYIPINESDLWEEWTVFCPTEVPPSSGENNDSLEIARTTKKPDKWEDDDFWNLFFTTKKPHNWEEEDFWNLLRTSKNPHNWDEDDIWNLLRTTKKPYDWEKDDFWNLLRTTRKPYNWEDHSFNIFRPTRKPYWPTVRPYDRDRDVLSRDRYTSKSSTDNKLIIILPIVAVGIILLLLCKRNSSSRSSATTLHPPPRRNASEPRPNGTQRTPQNTRTNTSEPTRNRTQHAPQNTRRSSRTFASGLVNDSLISDSSSDRPPRYSDVILGDFVVRQTNFPEVHVIPATPPPKYEEINVMRY